MQKKQVFVKFKYLILILFLPGLKLIAQAPQNSSDQKNSSKIELPYDRFIQPAGKQIVFGDPTLENHALDCAISPDGLWLAIEARNSIEIYSLVYSKIIYEYVMKDFLSQRDLMNCYSGITWYVKDNRNYVAWTATSNTTNISYLISRFLA